MPCTVSPVERLSSLMLAVDVIMIFSAEKLAPPRAMDAPSRVLEPTGVNTTFADETVERMFYAVAPVGAFPTSA